MSIPFKHVAFPAIAQEDETHLVPTPFGTVTRRRIRGEALHAAREPLSVLDEMRRALGPQHFSAQYLQMPAPPGGNIVKEAWFSRFDSAHPPPFDRVVQSWDTASKNNASADFSVCVTIGVYGERYYIIDVLRKRLEFPKLLHMVQEHAKLFRANIILVEESSSGIALSQMLFAANIAGVRTVKPTGNKLVRMDVHTPRLESGSVFLPHVAPWLDSYLHELMMFPNGRYDDQVDATSQAFDHLFQRTGVDAWMQAQKRWDQEERDQSIPQIRANHPDRSRQFQLVNGREIRAREADGSFLVTLEEALGLRRVPEIILPPEPW